MASKDTIQGQYFDAEVISYNVLCGKLGLGSTKSGTININPKRRLRRVFAQLKDPMKRRAIICLQEIGQDWSGDFFCVCQKNDYHLIYAPYGRPFNDFMGVAIAIPNERFEITTARISKPTNEKSWPLPPELTFWDRIMNYVYSFTSMWRSAKHNPWEIARKRSNSMITATLKCKKTGGSLCIATYHMPCVFWSPPAMIIHAALVMSSLQKHAKGIPYVLAGDFNAKPGDAVYKLYRDGKLTESHPDFPISRPWDKWRPNILEPVRSAYFETIGCEPELTNYGATLENPIFAGTLDYIFHSKRIRPQSVLELPKLSDMDNSKPLPNAEFPSDHLMIGSVLRVPIVDKTNSSV